MLGMILEAVKVLLILILFCIAYYIAVRWKMSEAAVDAINAAEELRTYGDKKMEYAIILVKDVIPRVARPFISDDMIKTVIQKIFDKINAFALKQVSDTELNK